MRNHADPTEIADITAEDNTQTKNTVKMMHDVLRGIHPAYAHWMNERSESMKPGSNFFPFRRLRDSVNFQGKSETFFLQLADVCAWIIRLYLEEKKGMDEFLTAFVPRDTNAIADLERVRANFAGVCEVRCWE